MRFKKATIDIRFSRESGQNQRGMFVPGITYHSRNIQELLPHMPVRLLDYGPEYIFMEINSNRDDDEIDSDIFINSSLAYSFAINGVVNNEYKIVRFYYHGYYYILEYRFLNRENS